MDREQGPRTCGSDRNAYFRVGPAVAVVAMMLLGACSSADSTSESVASSAAQVTTTTVPTTTTTTVPTTSSLSPPTTTTTVSSEPVEVVGIVVAVEGGLAGVDSFTLLLPDGDEATFVPAEGVLFDGTGPIAHLHDHRVSGAPVRVVFVLAEDGTKSAIAVGDE